MTKSSEKEKLTESVRLVEAYSKSFFVKSLPS